MPENTLKKIDRVGLILLLGIVLLGHGPSYAASALVVPTTAGRAVTPQPTQHIDLGPDLYLRRIGTGAWVVSHVFPFLCNSLLVEMPDGTFVLAGTPCTPEATQLVLDWVKQQSGERKIVAINTGYHVDNLGETAPC